MLSIIFYTNNKLSLSIFSENQMNFQLASTIEPNGNAQQNFRLGVTKVLGVLQKYLFTILQRTLCMFNCCF